LQAQVGVEAEEIGRAYRAVGSCHLLRGVEQVGEGESLLFRPAAHVIEGILRVIHRVIGHDRNAADAVFLQLARIADDPVDHRLDVRAVVADEHHQQPTFAFHVVQRVSFAIHAFEREGAGAPADGCLRGFKGGHGFFLLFADGSAFIRA